MSSYHPYLPSLGELKWCVLLCFGEHDALKSDGPTLLREHFAREWYPLVLRTYVVISPSLALPRGAEMVCFTILGEHDALKSDGPSLLKEHVAREWYPLVLRTLES